MTAKAFNKVFGIGLSRTGTTSLNLALMYLGLNSVHLPRNLDELESLDAATDTSIARAYKTLDTKYPNSRFILTVREEEEWVQSCNDFFAGKQIAPWLEDLQVDIYGTRDFDQLMYRLARRQHHKNVFDYFSERRQDLLVLDICAGEGWEKLCPFLGLPMPQNPFPHTNSS